MYWLVPLILNLDEYIFPCFTKGMDSVLIYISPDYRRHNMMQEQCDCAESKVTKHVSLEYKKGKNNDTQGYDWGI